MTVSQTVIIFFIIGSTVLLAIPDNSVASDKFFQTGGRFGKRHEERISDIRFTDMLKTRSVDNVPPRIERGFYISRYGKRNTNSVTDSNYFNLCFPFYGLYCDFTGLPNLLRCKRVRPEECTNAKYANDKYDKIQSKSEDEPLLNNY